MTSAKMTAQETNDYYSKRDCVEKTFQALKSHLGMDKIGVTTEEAMHGKGLVWFVASILHAILFNKTSALRTTERKCFTVPAMIDQLEAIKADKNLSTGKRERRYKLTNKQKQILNFWDLDEVQIDQKIASISE
jgi:transposase